MDIRATIESNVSIPSAGRPYVEQAVTALEAREAAIVDSLRAYAMGRGLSDQEVDNALRGAGLLAPEPPRPSFGDEAAQVTLEERVAAMERLGQRLLDAAERNGITI